jgi:hypothetical protein
MRSQKATYPGLHGETAAREFAARVHQQAHATLDELDRPTTRLHAIADYILNRSS